MSRRPLDDSVELGTAVVVLGLWSHPHLNGRVAIVSETGDFPGRVHIALREQYSNELLFHEVEDTPAVGLLKNVPLANLALHTNAHMAAPPPPRPRWSKATAARINPSAGARTAGRRPAPVIAKRVIRPSLPTPPPLKRQTPLCASA